MGWILAMFLITNASVGVTQATYSTKQACDIAGQIFIQTANALPPDAAGPIKSMYTCTAIMQ